MDFDAVADAHFAQDRTHRRMLDLFDVVHELDARVDDAVLVLEERRQVAHTDAAIFVDRHAEHGPAVLAVPDRVIRAAAEQRDPERSAADDHATLRTARDRALPAEWRPRALAITGSAWAKLSGVPMSRKVTPSAGIAAKVPAGAAPNTSRSSEAPVPLANSCSHCRENRYSPALMAPGRVSAGSFSRNCRMRPTSSMSSRP